LCNPKDQHGNNATPTKTELENCSGYLKRQLAIVNPAIVVTLGNQALQALKLIEPHTLELSKSVRHSWAWYNRSLIPLYHPGQRAMMHRSFLNQLADYQFVAEQLKRRGRSKPARVERTSADVSPIVSAVLQASGSITYFRLHKLFYLVEYYYARENNKRLTSSYVVRQKDGPYFVDLHISKLRRSIPGLVVQKRGASLMLSQSGDRDLFETPVVAPQVAQLISRIIIRYRDRSDEELKTAVYLTSPMRAFLSREKFGGANLFNAPLDFSSVFSARGPEGPSSV
jgi:hypothetical protein